MVVLPFKITLRSPQLECLLYFFKYSILAEILVKCSGDFR
jgi:hypothetical protein